MEGRSWAEVNRRGRGGGGGGKRGAEGDEEIREGWREG